MKSDGKVKKLAKYKMPKCPAYIKGAGREEWTRVARRLFSMGRLYNLEGIALAGYCASYEILVGIKNDISKSDPADQKLLKALKSLEGKFLRGCRDSALGFGFPVDADGRMNLDKPMSLASANRILTAKRDREEKRIRDRYWIDSLPHWLQVPTYLPEGPAMKEWARTAPALYAAGRLDTKDDQTKLEHYCRTFEEWRRLKVWSKRDPKQIRLHTQAENRLKKLAWQLGASFDIKTGLDVESVIKAKRK